MNAESLYESRGRTFMSHGDGLLTHAKSPIKAYQNPILGGFALAQWMGSGCSFAKPVG